MRASPTWFLVVAGTAAAACGGRSPQLCGQVECVANSVCVERDEADVCECADGYVLRGGRCQPEGPCGRLARATCEAVGNDPVACGALRTAVAVADGAMCERRLSAGVLEADVGWLGEVQPMLARAPAAEYANVLVRSLLDPCGAATTLLCSIMRPGVTSCGSDASEVPDDDRGCRTLIRGYDQSVAGVGDPGEGLEGLPEGPAETVEVPGVVVRLIPDPAGPGSMPGGLFREALLARRDEIEACYSGAVQSFPGLSGRAVFQVRISAEGAVDVSVGRADGPVVGSGVADCVREALAGLDLTASPPAGGEMSVHAAFVFGVQ